MNQAEFSNAWRGDGGGADEEILPRLREDLVVSEQQYSGQPFWVVKDPVSLKYYRFSREEYFLMQLMKQGATLDQLQERHLAEFHGDRLTGQELGGFVRSLLEKNLLESRHPQRDELLYEAGRRKRRKMLIGQVKNFLFFRIPLVDPDAFFDRVIRYVRFVWSWPFLLIYLIALAVGTGLLIRRWDDFQYLFTNEFLTLYNLPFVIAVFWLTKAIHELGHGLTCKHFGGECHEIGLMFLVFTPFLFCNVTDSWMFVRKRDRVLVTAAGILTELFLAAVAAIVWYFTDPSSFTHILAFNVVITCSISTILFNANPLMRFDGYYMLMDAIEVPNLRQRAMTFLRNVFVRYVLGGYPEEKQEEHRYRLMFPIYAVAAFIYKWIITFSILAVVYSYLKQFRLEWLGRGMVIFSIGSMILMPTYQMANFMVRRRTSLGISNVRVMALLVVLVGFLAYALFLPFSRHVTANFVLEPATLSIQRAEAPGEVDWTFLQESRALESVPQAQAGESLARLSNPDLLIEQRRLEVQLEQTQIQIRQQQTLNRREEVSRLEAERQAVEEDLQRIGQQIAQLEVVPAISGQVLSRRQEVVPLQGRFVPRGTPLLMIGDPSEMLVKVWVSEKDHTRIFHEPDQREQAAKMMLYAFPDRSFGGQVVDVSRHKQDSLGEFGEKLALSNKVGGEVVTEYDAAADTEVPIETVYEVTIRIDEGELPSAALPFLSGRVRIDCGKSTLYAWTRDSLLRFISPEVRL